MEILDLFLLDFISYFILGMSASFIAIKVYFFIANKFNIFAYVNNRSLHSTQTITSAGIIIPILLLSFLVLEYFFINKNIFNLTNYLILSCTFFSIIGLIDDKFNLSAKNKFILQILLSLVLLFVNLLIFKKFIFNGEILILLLYFLFLSLFFLNTFNFLDGIDGMALSIFTFTLICYTIFFRDNFYLNSVNVLYGILFILLFYNIQKKCFIGDSGSLFLGSLIGFITIFGVYFYNWDIILIVMILSYWITDTFITFFTRLLFVKNWYGTHTMHPYQNLAKYFSGHFKVIIILNFFNFLYILPIALFYINFPKFKFILLFLTFLPTIIFCLKFGPLKNLGKKDIVLFGK